MQRRDFLTSMLIAGPLAAARASAAEAPAPLRIATFQADVTPPLGTPLCHGMVMPAKKILDPLSARGIILFAKGGPIVLCAFDWTGFSNEGNDVVRDALAAAVGTSRDRVAVHTVHQHNAPGIDFTTEKILVEFGLSGKMFDVAVANDAIKRVAKAAAEAAKNPRRLTHIGCGLGKVEKVASTRRVLNPDGTLRFWRSSKGGSKEMKAAPEGLIDPYVRLLSFWDGDRPLASLTYYACHPCAWYGHGGVSSEIMGLARAARQAALPEVAHVHFNGAGGDIAVGKYNDNTLATRPRLAERLAAGMKIAWQTQEKTPLTAADVSWRVRPVLLPVKRSYSEAKLLRELETMKGPAKPRVHVARRLAWLRRLEAGCHTDIGCLRIGPARVLHMPGELFVAYQLAAQKMRPDKFVCMAAYGEDGATYIGTKSEYPKGGYEVGMSRVAPEVEDVLMTAMRELLDR
jgi:hypothetical protein